MLSRLQRGEQLLEGVAATLGAAEHRDLALEAAIAVEPSEPDQYLVYADWLQARGDARGTLISLHDAARRGSTDAAAGAAVLLESHGHSLLGELYMRNDVELTWFQGFIRAIRLTGNTIGQLVSALRGVFATPSGAFIQAITIQYPIQVERIVALLLEHAPPTLAFLQIGKPNEWFLPQELIDRCPRLAREPAVVWQDAVIKAGKHKGLALGIDPATLPPLELSPGLVGATTATILAGLKAELANHQPIGMIAALRACASPESRDRFALALAQHWETRRAVNQLWALEASGVLGGDECVGFLAEGFVTWTHPRAIQALQYLRRIDNDMAIAALARFATNAALPGPRRSAAVEMLEQVALTRNVDSMTQLLAQTCPRYWNSRTAHLLLEQQRRWLHDLMIDGQRMSAADFERHVARHALRRRLAAGLVWCECAVGKVLTAFTIDGDGGLRTRDGSVHRLAADARVGVVHPLELPLAQRIGWNTVEPSPFAQLDRPLFELTAAERTSDRLVRFDERRIGFTALVPRLVSHGWAPFNDNDGAWYTRAFPRDHVLARVKLGGGAATGARLRLVGHWQDRRLDAHHPVTISELLADLEAIHAPGLNRT